MLHITLNRVDFPAVSTNHSYDFSLPHLETNISESASKSSRFLKNGDDHKEIPLFWKWSLIPHRVELRYRS